MGGSGALRAQSTRLQGKLYAELLGYKYNKETAASYTDGDLNYDGIVDFFDLATVLSANFNKGTVFTPAQAATIAQASVPEPSGAAALTLSTLVLLAVHGAVGAVSKAAMLRPGESDGCRKRRRHEGFPSCLRAYSNF